VAELAKFWDTYEATHFDKLKHEINMMFERQSRCFYVAINPDLWASLQKVAQRRGIMVETLVNLWLQERILSKPKP
jgi:hypothetical protein